MAKETKNVHAGKLGHACPDPDCGKGQLYQADDGLACPACGQVFQPMKPPVEELAEPKAKK